MSDVQNDRDDRLAGLLTEALETFRDRRTVDVAAWQARYPDLADELPALLDTLRGLDTAVSDWKAIASPETGALPLGTAAADAPERRPTLTLPRQVGRYRILGRIGEGGMGTVYRAEDPELQRVIALKVPRFDGPERYRATATKRFLREARAAAQVRHPHVCPIHDVGEQEGVPFVVMDYVEGQSLADRLDGQNRYEDPAEAVRLVRQVAEALEAVHAKGLVHRDLKPGNILLDTCGRAILTDFGLARSEQDGEHLTADGALVGTPAYMAPEQASLAAGPVGPWSDIYSLGVVLYQMLSGRLPFEGPVLRMLYRTAHETPAPPSQGRPDLDPAVDAIVLRAMARRPEERYPTAREFAGALARWSASTPASTRTGEPAEAVAAPGPAPTVVRAALPDGQTVTVSLETGAVRPDKMKVSVREQRGRQKRRLLTVSVTLTLGLLLAVGGLGTLVLTRTTRTGPTGYEVSHAGPGAAAPPADGRGTGRSGVPDGPGQAAPTARAPHEGTPPEPVRASSGDQRQQEERRRKATEAQMAEGQAAFRQAETLRTAGKLNEAAAEYRKALAVWGRMGAPSHPNIALAYHNLADCLQARGGYGEAEAFLKLVLDDQRRRLGADHPDTLASMSKLAGLYRASGRYDQAEPLYREVVEARRRKLGTDHPDTLASLGDLAALCQARGRYDEAEALFKQVLETRRQKLGPDHPDSLAGLTNLAVLYQARGQYEQAESLLKQALDLDRRQLGPDHSDTLRSMNRLADLYQEQGRYAEAENLYTQVLEARRRQVGSDPPEIAQSYHNLALNLQAQGRPREAESLLRKVLIIKKEVLGPRHPDIATCYSNLAANLEVQGRYKDAEPLYREALSVWEEALGPRHPETAAAHSNLGNALREQGKLAEALEAYRQAVALKPDFAAAHRNLGLTLREQGKLDEAATEFCAAVNLAPGDATAHQQFGTTLRAAGRLNEAVAEYEKALELAGQTSGKDPLRLASIRADAAAAYQALGQTERAVQLYQQSLEARQALLGPDHPDVSRLRQQLAALRDPPNRPMVEPAPVARTGAGYRHFYSSWHPTQYHYYYRSYYYKPNAYDYVIYYPQYPRYLYYYNPVSKVYWGRFDIKTRGYSLLAEADRKGALKDIPEKAFPEPGELPPIHGDKDQDKVQAPPTDDLPTDLPAGEDVADPRKATVEAAPAPTPTPTPIPGGRSHPKAKDNPP
jgi:tetratricopeptide (TPR) repeat protein